MKACIVYGTRYGNTEKVARSLEAGLRASGLETACTNQTDTPPERLAQYDLICIGAPTEAFSIYKPTKEFLARLGGLAGKFGFAFDTKIESRFSGSAAKGIEKELSDLGLRIVTPRESAIVFTEGGTKGAHLKEGEEARFEHIGRGLGEALAAKATVA